ncbi:MAG TPA: thioredoxin [archaeon]|nr:thioredoxin [archaeon]
MKTLSDSDFGQFIMSKKPVVIDFWAEWCGPCRMSSPIFDELSKEMGAKLEFAKMNIDENPETPSKYGIMSIPTFLVFKEGEIIGEIHGAMPKNAFKEQIEQALVE